jgi:hypothetical protein
MADLKIITHTTYTYETTDGREFDSRPEAEAWQKAIDNAERIVMLDSRFRATDDVEMAYFVFIKDQDQVDAFNAKQANLGLAAVINVPGYYYYDEVSDEYFNVDGRIKDLLGIKAKLDNIAK